MNEGVMPSADFKVDKNGRKYPAKRIHMGEKEQVSEASYRGNIGVMELAKFHSSASASDKEQFTQLMRKKSAAKSEKEEQQMASQIWDHVQKVTGTKLHQMESTDMLPFKLMVESNDDFILQTLADRDINASIKDGKVVVHDHSQHAKAKSMVKRMGMTHEVVKGIKEDFELNEALMIKSPDGKGKVHRPGSVGISVNPNQSEQGKLGNRYSVFFKPNGPRTSFVDLSHHKSEDEAKEAKAAYVKKHEHHGVVGLKGLGENTSTTVQEAMPTHEFNNMVRGYLKHKKAAKIGGFKPMSIDQYKRVSVKALSVSEDTIEEESLEELSKDTLKKYQRKAMGDTTIGKEAQRMGGVIRSDMKIKAKEAKPVDESKTVSVPVLKPRNPNQLVLAAKKNAAGAHRDKKREMKGGVSKHRNRADE